MAIKIKNSTIGNNKNIVIDENGIFINGKKMDKDIDLNEIDIEVGSISFKEKLGGFIGTCCALFLVPFVVGITFLIMTIMALFGGIIFLSPIIIISLLAKYIF